LLLLLELVLVLALVLVLPVPPVLSASKPPHLPMLGFEAATPFRMG
jgi:hypothetical protein